MQAVLSMFNIIVCAAIAVALTWAVLSPRVNDGIVIKFGMILMIMGFSTIAWRMSDGVVADDGVHLAKSVFLINAGLLVVGAGYVWRCARAGRPQRRRTDFSNLDTRPVEHAR